MTTPSPRLPTDGSDRASAPSRPGRAVAVGFALGALAVLVPPSTAAQAVDDVVRLGERYGTTPPAEYFELKASRPEAFEFSRAWKRRNPNLRVAGFDADGRPEFEAIGPDAIDTDPGTAAALGPRDGPVEGTVRFPLLLGYFANDPTLPEFSRDDLQREYFDGPNSYLGTIPEYYAEVSGGRLAMVGETLDWVRSTLTREEVTGGSSGLGGSARVGEFIIELLVANEGIDWGAFDNDGPDGIPNSGDDDGFVDVVAVMHPTHGGECNDEDRDNRIWSHRWSIRSSTGQWYTTTTPAANGGTILVDDYTIQPMRACAGGNPINGIGVFAHELGHGFGLPDLYDTSGVHEGIGEWGLMGSGSWGCLFSSLAVRPCHMSAWSKEQLGWVDVVELPPGDDQVLTLSPVETDGTVYRVNAQDGSGEYFLLENRQEVGFDLLLRERGLLVWHVDPRLVVPRWPTNTVNASSTMGVFLEQADGRNDLGAPSGNRGDDGDPFPGSGGRTDFHFGSTPASFTNDGNASGLTLVDVRLVGDDVTVRAVTGFREIRLDAEGDEGLGAEFLVDGETVATGNSFTSSPFQSHTVAAGGGGEVSDGVRVDFDGWSDGVGARVRDFVTGLQDETLTAVYGGREVRARIGLAGGEAGVAPGVVTFDPAAFVDGDDYWLPEGTEALVRLEEATGFRFQRWEGALTGQGNPASIRLDAPIEATAVFEGTYGIPENRVEEVEAARPIDIRLEAQNGEGPVRWRLTAGRLPDGVAFSEAGVVSGAALEAGTFQMTLEAEDARGLTAEGVLTLEVAIPTIPVEKLAGPFLANGEEPSAEEALFLDRLGNENGSYDLGDLRAFILTGALPSSVSIGKDAVIRAALAAGRDGGGGDR